jgi:hypothetical protein
MYDVHYHRPASLEDALNLLAGADEPKILAGGQTLLPTMKQHLAAPSDLVDVRKIPGMKGVRVEGGTSSSGRPRPMPRSRATPMCSSTSPRSPASPRDRRPGGAPHGHHRRVHRQQRPGGGLPLGGARAERRPW